jgi:8-oxo-dGTP diphosphatase
MAFPLTAVASVGGLVVDDDRLLVVRHTYPPSASRYMLPGGVVDPGAMLEVAVVREVAEGIGITAVPLGIAGVSSIVHEGVTHAYVFWLMRPIAGDLNADGLEIDHCCYVSFDEITARDDVSHLVKYVANRLRKGTCIIAGRADDFTDDSGGLTPETYRIYM